MVSVLFFSFALVLSQSGCLAQLWKPDWKLERHERQRHEKWWEERKKVSTVGEGLPGREQRAKAKAKDARFSFEERPWFSHPSPPPNRGSRTRKGATEEEGRAARSLKLSKMQESSDYLKLSGKVWFIFFPFLLLNFSFSKWRKSTNPIACRVQRREN